jgi:uncharacterized membrane protein
MPAIGVLHVALAILALLAGATVALLPKGEPAHRRLGWVYVVSMVGVNLTALSIYRLLGVFGPFHWAAAFSLMTVVAGIIPVRRRTNRFWIWRHAYWMTGSYVGLWAAAVAETVTRTSVLPFWSMVGLASAVVMGLGMALMFTLVPRAVRRMKGRSRR